MFVSIFTTKSEIVWRLQKQNNSDKNREISLKATTKANPFGFLQKLAPFENHYFWAKAKANPLGFLQKLAPLEKP